MNTRSMTLRVAAIAAAFTLIGCDNTVPISPVYVSVSNSPRPISIPVGGTQVFTGTVSNNLGLPQWSILASVSATSSVGTLTPTAAPAIRFSRPPVTGHVNGYFWHVAVPKW